MFTLETSDVTNGNIAAKRKGPAMSISLKRLSVSDHKVSLPQVLNDFRHKLNASSPLAYHGSLFLIVGCVATLLLATFDPTVIGGINRWIKPAKFFLSIAIYVATMGWLLRSISSEVFRRRMNRAVLFTMGMEAFIITLQAARGTPSHFNETTMLNGLLYSLMGVFAIAQIPIAMIVFYRLQKERTRIPFTYLRGMQIGLALFILSCIEGAFMSVHGSHTVGGADGEVGLALVNWSLRHGDLRIAHFVGMHALQIFPLLAFLISKRNQRTLELYGVMGLFLLVNAALFLQAYAGRSLFLMFP